MEFSHKERIQAISYTLLCYSSDMHCVSHKIHRGISGHKITEAQYIVLSAMFGTNSLRRLGWWTNFQKSSKTYIVEQGVVTPKIKIELREAAKKAKLSVAGNDTQPRVKAETAQRSRPAVGVKVAENANRKATPGADKTVTTQVDTNKPKRDVLPNTAKNNDEAANKGKISNSEQQGRITRKRKRGDGANCEQPQEGKTNITAEQKLAEMLQTLARRPKTNATLRARVEVLEARHAVHDEKIRKLEALVLGSNEAMDKLRQHLETVACYLVQSPEM